MIGTYRRAVEGSPENLVLRTDLADLHLRYGLLDDAVVQYRQILMRRPDSVSLRHRLIQAYLWTEDYEEAAAALLELSELHSERGEHQDALDVLQSVLSLDPHHFVARRRLVDRFASLGQSNLAAHHLRQLAEAAMTKGNTEEAVLAFRQLMSLSDDPGIEERLAHVYEIHGDREKALEHYRNLARRYREGERWEEAAKVTEKVVALDSEDLEARRVLVELYRRLERQDKVAEAQFDLARLHHNRGSLQRAVELYEALLGIQPDHHEARRHLVDACVDSGEMGKALAHAGILTEYYAEMRKPQAAIEMFRRLVEVDPESAEHRRKLILFLDMAGEAEEALHQWLVLADLYSAVGDHQEAVAAFRKALELAPERTDLHYRLACLYADVLQDRENALKELEQVHKSEPGHREAMDRYARMLLEEGQAEAAARVLRELEKADPDATVVREAILDAYRSRIAGGEDEELTGLRFIYGELCYHLGVHFAPAEKGRLLDYAIEQFQRTRGEKAYELRSYDMLGRCFAAKGGLGMVKLAIKQFEKGIECRGHPDQDYLELRYNLGQLLYHHGKLQEALKQFKEIYMVDIAYRDVNVWIEQIEAELRGDQQGKVRRLRPQDKKKGEAEKKSS